MQFLDQSKTLGLVRIFLQTKIIENFNYPAMPDTNGHLAKSNPHTLIFIFQTTFFHQYTGKEMQYCQATVHELPSPI
jgi:hypothetical protein